MTDKTRRALAAAAVGLASLAMYAATMAPALTWAHDSADGGELAVAAQSLGIAHPPGYPTYVLLAHPWTLVPLGELATRTNLFSAACAAAASAVVAWAAARSGHSPLAGVAAGLAAAGMPLLWAQAVVTEVHALNALFTAVILALAVEADVGRRHGQEAPRYVAPATGLVWGLSMGNSPTAAFIAPVALAGLIHDRRSAVRGAAGVCLGLSVYLLLPIRASVDPAVNWGDPDSIDRFVWVVSGALYRHYVFAFPISSLPSRLLAYAQIVAGQYGMLGLALASVGAASSWSCRRRLLATTGAVFVLCSAFAIGFDTPSSYQYLLPALICASFWAGMGASWLAFWSRKRGRWLGTAVGVLILVMFSLGIILRAPRMNLRQDRGPRRFVNAVLGAAPQRSVVLSNRDSWTFALWYFQQALGMRPDVAIVDPGLLGLDWYNRQVAKRLGLPGTLAGALATSSPGLDEAARALARPVCVVTDDARLTCAGSE